MTKPKLCLLKSEIYQQNTLYISESKNISNTKNYTNILLWLHYDNTDLKDVKLSLSIYFYSTVCLSDYGTYICVCVMNKYAECWQNLLNGLEWRRRVLVSAQVYYHPGDVS